MEALIAEISKPFAVCFIGGRNEDGSHVLLSGARSIDDAELAELLEDTTVDGVCEQIIAEAMKHGFCAGDCVWANFYWNKPQIGEFGRVEYDGYWEFTGLNIEISAAMRVKDLAA